MPNIKINKKKFLAILITIVLAANSQVTKTNSPKLIDSFFESEIKKLTKVFNQNTNDNTAIELYKEIENEEDDSEWNYKSVLRIGNYYQTLNLGKDHSLEIKDILGIDGIPEIIIETGCFSDAGCLNELIVIRYSKGESFILKNFGNASLINNTSKLDEDNFNKTLIEKDLMLLRKQGEFIISTYVSDSKTNKCYILLRSIKPFKKGFSNGTYLKKSKQFECAG